MCEICNSRLKEIGDMCQQCWQELEGKGDE